jgi:Flp pilus assembly protein TadD
MSMLVAIASSDAIAKQANPLAAARSARIAGRLDDAERLLNVALKAKPTDYATLYNMGLVYDLRARATKDRDERLRLLKIAASYLESATLHVGDSPANEPTIFNTLGYVYIEEGDLASAESSLLTGLKHLGQLSNDSKGKLYSNLGYVRALLGDTEAASNYFKIGAAYGNANAKANLSRLQLAK